MILKFFSFLLFLLFSLETAYAQDKIALLFLTHFDLNQSELWKQLLKSSQPVQRLYSL